MSSLIGKLLQGGKYKLETVLGRGGFGLTFRAHQTYLDQVVVIKTLNESFWQAPNLNDLQRQFQDEARRLAMCSHPNVVRVSDFFVEDGLPYMVMDYIPGRSLSDIVLPDNALPEATALSYVQQIGRALQAVHAKGLLHRDVKPQNIMIHELTGEAILIDFGIARELTQNPAKTQTSIVSEGYAPIEQYLPKAERSAATDIYGLAATLYTLLTADTPVAAVLRDRTSLTPVQQLRPDVSDQVAAAIAQGMAVELRDRPQSIGHWIESLSSYADKTDRFNRPRQRQSEPPIPPSISHMPTRVVAPGRSRDRSAPGRFASVETSQKTVAMPLPTEYGATRGAIADASTGVVERPEAQRGGCGCVSTLALTALAIAGLFAGGGFWAYRQITGGLGNLDLSGPVVQLPSGEETNDDVVAPPEEEETIEPEEALPEEPIEEPEVVEPVVVVPSAPPTPSRRKPPLLLTSSGDPDNLRPGDPGPIVRVPGLSPGTLERKVRDILGTPTTEGAVGGFYTTVYEVMPNRVSLAYVYEPDATGRQQVRQSEASFSSSTSWLIMRTALGNMLDGRSTRNIEAGLKAVKNGERDRFDFERQGFSGAIERNDFGHIHIYVRQ